MNIYEESNPIQSTDINSIFTNTFFRMFLGLLASGITALYTYFSGLYITLFTSNIWFGLCITEILVVFIFSFAFKKLSPAIVTILFFAYSFLNGFTLSIIFAAYEMETICYAFIATSALFGVLAFLGYKTDKDISSLGTISTVLLIIGIILTLFNLIIKSSFINIFLDWFVLFVFFGLTIYDMNKIKLMQQEGFCDDEKIYVYGAMQLYLDFINMFLRILSIIARRKR